MSDTTLGQIAYETFVRSNNPDASETKWRRWWPALSPKDQERWQGAAQAVADEVQKCPTCDGGNGIVVNVDGTPTSCACPRCGSKP